MVSRVKQREQKKRALPAARADEARNKKKEERKAEQSRARQPVRQEAPRKGTKSSNAIIRYFQETADELRKVSWPTREQTTRLTLIVLGTTVTFAIVLGALDLLFRLLGSLLV